MNRTLAMMIGFGIVLAGSAPARAQVIHYQGPHPIAPSVGKGMCWIEGPHVHRYAPHKALLYVRVGPAFLFVGDPVEFEADAPNYAYYGHHPVFWYHRRQGRHHRRYCYIPGPHHHWYPPPARLEVKYKRKGGVLWYVGPHPKWYRKHHWRGRAWGHYYRKHHFRRPVVTVEPPVGWVGVVVTGPGFRVHGGFNGYIRAGLKGPHAKGLFKIKGPMGHFKGHRGMGHYKGHWGMGHGMGHGHWYRGRVKGMRHGHRGMGMH